MNLEQSKVDSVEKLQEVIEKVKNAQKEYAKFSQEQVDKIFQKAAIKANDSSSDQELLAIVREVYTNENIRYCPHGRPVVIVTSKYELEKKFHRIV